MLIFDTEIENELTILQDIIKIRLREKNNPTLNHNTRFLSYYSPYNYLVQNPELNYIIGIETKNNCIFNKFNHREYSLSGLLNQVTKVLKAYIKNVKED